MTKEALEELSGRGYREDWFEEGGCPELSKLEKWSASSCRRNGVNLEIFTKGTIPAITTTTIGGIR